MLLVAAAAVGAALAAVAGGARSLALDCGDGNYCNNDEWDLSKKQLFCLDGDGADVKDRLVWCRAENGKKCTVRVYPCYWGCQRDDHEKAIMDYCRSPKMQASNSNFRSERGEKWTLRVEDGAMTDMAGSESAVDPCDGSVYMRTSKAIRTDHKTDDLIMSGYEWDGLPPFAAIHGIEVKTRARSSESVGDARCFPTDLELKSDGRTSGNRGYDGVAEAVDEWTTQVYGGRFDPWDGFTSQNLFTSRSFWVESDYDVLSDSPDGSAKCDVDCAIVTVYYDDPLPAVHERVTLISAGPAGTPWSYYYQPEPPSGGDPRRDAFDDQHWSVSRGPFGYGNGGENTYLNPISKNHKPLTAYFRTTFEIDNVDCMRRIKITAKIDDGAIFWLNEQPLWWLNMNPEDKPGFFNTSARYAYDEDEDKTGIIPDTILLVNGTNHMMVEVHQAAPDSSDLTFDMSMETYNICNAHEDRPPVAAPPDCRVGAEKCECKFNSQCDDGLHCSASDICVKINVDDVHNDAKKLSGVRGKQCKYDCADVCGGERNVLVCPTYCADPPQCLSHVVHGNTDACKPGTERCQCKDGDQKCDQQYLSCLSELCVRTHDSRGGNGSEGVGAEDRATMGSNKRPNMGHLANSPSSVADAGDGDQSGGGAGWIVGAIIVGLLALIAFGLAAFFLRRRQKKAAAAAVSWQRLGADVGDDEEGQLAKPSADEI